MNPSPASGMRYEVAFLMHRGAAKTQQDALAIGDQCHQRDDLGIRQASFDSGLLVALADGLAVSPDARAASLHCVSALGEFVARHPDWSFNGLVNARHVRAVHRSLCEAVQHRRIIPGASTTLVAVHLQGTRLAVVNSGDSRAYLVRAGCSPRPLSHDHTERSRMIEAGEWPEDFIGSSVYSALSDCLVAGPDTDDFAVHGVVLDIVPGDRIVLCTDGVHDVLPDDAWESMLSGNLELRDFVTTVRTGVFAVGAEDNFSLIAVDLAS